MSSLRGPLRVLMTADTVGGVWTYSLELARSLAARDVHVWLATMGAPLSGEQWQRAAAIDNLEIIESDYALEWMDEPWRDVYAAGEWLLELERRLDVDLVHVNGYSHAALPFSVPVVAVAHSCVCSWWRAVNGCEAPAGWDLYRRRIAAGLSAADEVVAPTRAILDAVLDAHGCKRRGQVIANGLDPRGYGPVAKQPMVLSAGRMWDAAKNLHSLDACAGAVPWPVLVAGPTAHPGGGAIQARAVRLLGSLPPHELHALMSRAAVYALPARYEPFGLSVLEAALSGCALVLGDIASLREVWGDAAVFVPPDDTGAIGTALWELAHDPARRARLAERAQQRAARYTSERMGADYLRLYVELVDGEVHAGEERGACG